MKKLTKIIFSLIGIFISIPITLNFLENSDINFNNFLNFENNTLTIFGFSIIINNVKEEHIINDTIEPKKLQEIEISTNYSEYKQGSNIKTRRYKNLYLPENSIFKDKKYQVNNLFIKKKDKDQNKLENIEIAINCTENIKILGYSNNTDVKAEIKPNINKLILNIEKMDLSTSYNYSICLLLDINESIESENCTYYYSYDGLDVYTNLTELNFINEI